MVEAGPLARWRQAEGGKEFMRTCLYVHTRTEINKLRVFIDINREEGREGQMGWRDGWRDGWVDGMDG